MADKNESKFFPYYFFEVVVVALLTVEVVLIIAALFPPAIGREVDFAAQYRPLPEWYFLFLYQLTKYFPGPWTFVGAALLPSLAFGLMLLAPFLDRGPERKLRRRPGAAVIGVGLLAAALGLTMLALL